MKIVFFGDGLMGMKSMEYLYSLGHNLVGLVVRKKPSSFDLEDFATQKSINVSQPENVNAIEFVDYIRSLQAEIGVCVSYDQMFRKEIINLFPRGFINAHTGKLPYYRGRNGINWSIINGEQEIGLTIHLINEGIDTGDILCQECLPIEWTETYQSLLDKIACHFPPLLEKAINNLSSNTRLVQPQSLLSSTYFPKRILGDEWIDWEANSVDIYNLIRGISDPGPGAKTVVGKKVMIVWRATYDLSWPKYRAIPGAVVGRTTNGIFVKTLDSIILLNEVQFALDNRMCPNLPISTRLGINKLDLLHNLHISS